MRLIKMLGLAAIAAVAAMAFLGVSTASATKATLLCSNNTPLVPLSEKECGPVKTVHFASAPLPGRADNHGLLLGTVTVPCNVLLSATTTQLLVNAGAQVHFPNANLVYSNCLNNFHVLVITPGTVLVLKTAPGLAEVTASGFVVRVLGNGLDCDYDAVGLVGHGLDAADGFGHVTFTEKTVNIKEKLGGFLPCPSAGGLDLLLKSLTPLYIRS